MKLNCQINFVVATIITLSLLGCLSKDGGLKNSRSPQGVNKDKVEAAALKVFEMKENYAPTLEDVLQFIWKRDKERMHGKVQFQDMYAKYPLVHMQSPEKLPYVMECAYETLLTAPVQTANDINPRVPLFEVYYYESNKHKPVVTDFSIDFMKKGDNLAATSVMTPDPEVNCNFQKGVATIVRPLQFCVKKDGKWLRNGRNSSWLRLKTPFFFTRSSITQKLVFTVADLSKFEIKIKKFESDWKSGGTVRIQLVVNDADREEFPVLNVPAAISDGKRAVKLETEFDLRRMPTGFLRGRLPNGPVPETLGFYAKVSALLGTNPLKKDERVITAEFAKGYGQTSVKKINKALTPIKLPRNKAGTVLETRALYTNDSALLSRSKIDDLVRRADKANLNMIIPCVYHLDKILVKSEIYPNLYKKIEKDLDPLAYLIKKAHEKNIEVHVWFCVNTGNQKLRDWFKNKYKVNITAVSVDKKQNSRVISKYAIDLQKQAYRDYIVALMLEAVKNYDVDGLHLDYIRAKTHSSSKENQIEFKKRIGKEIFEATTQDWIDWWRDPVADVVYRSDLGLKKLDKRAILSASVASSSYTWKGRIQGQNPDEWAEKTGLIICPMDYTAQTVLFLMNERGFLNALGKNRDCLIAGLGLYDSLQTHYPKPDVVSGNKIRDFGLVNEQITVTRNLGIHGYNLFNDQRLTDDMAEYLRQEVNKEKAIPFFRR